MTLKSRIASSLLVLVLAATFGETFYDGNYSEEDLDYDKVFDGYNDAYFDYVTENSKSKLNVEGTLRQAFAADLALSNPDKSMVCSPISALIPLGKLAIGAEDVCLDQLLNVIGVHSKSKLKKAFKPVIRGLQNLPGVTLSVVSKIYVSDEIRLHSKFRKRAKKIFKTGVETVDFNKPAETASSINNWVSDKTYYKIPNIISENEISPHTSMLLVNAIYFAGFWDRPFKMAIEDNFYTDLGISTVPMMTREGQYKYAKSHELDSQVVEIPYQGYKSSFIVILPNTKDGLSVLLHKIKLAPDLLQNALNKLKMMDILLTIPKFKISSQVDLKVSYEKLGLTEIFKTNHSGLEKIVRGEKNIHISKATQKAVIEVNEYGTESAAASTVNIALLSLVKRPRFKANRPFMFMIKVGRETFFSGIFTNSWS